MQMNLHPDDFLLVIVFSAGCMSTFTGAKNLKERVEFKRSSQGTVTKSIVLAGRTTTIVFRIFKY